MVRKFFESRSLSEQINHNVLPGKSMIRQIPGDMPGVPWKSLMFINDARPKGKFTICKFAGETDDCCLLTDLVNEDWLWKLNVHCGTTMMSLMTICSENKLMTWIQVKPRGFAGKDQDVLNILR
ncbi:hypothetical protein HAX54_016645 [Datura stramonium]|uniref:Uncharacterized protein n=1 Tax=Datura stramonium TaxID=4076 RepID=A0ABS8UKG9_DATST|nr:hypothetical protein [Datura stramonium]